MFRQHTLSFSSNAKHDIAVAGDEACRLYHKRTPLEERIAKELRDAISNAIKKTVKVKKSEYDKHVAIANPMHGPNFLAEVGYSNLTSLNVNSYLLHLEISILNCRFLTAD